MIDSRVEVIEGGCSASGRGPDGVARNADVPSRVPTFPEKYYCFFPLDVTRRSLRAGQRTARSLM